MGLRIALLLPLAALVAVAGMLAAVLMLHDASPSPAAGPGATATAPAGAPRLKPESSVCQSILHRPDPTAPRTYPAIYTQVNSAKGIAIVADAKVSQAAIDAAKQTLERIFENNDLAAQLAEQGAYIIIADPAQNILDLPEFGCLSQSGVSGEVGHACGIADRADYPVATVNQLDLLGDRRGPCAGLNILFHEVGHLVQGWTLPQTDYIDIKLDYQAALDAGKYRRAYASTNANEYFAEATQAYFLHVNPDGTHDRAWLQQYDPAIYELAARVYGD